MNKKNFKISHFRKIVLTTFISAFISGCASQKPYVAPEGIPHATIFFNPFYEGSLFLIGPVICSSQFGTKRNYRETTQIANFRKRSKPTTVNIASSNSVSFRAEYYTSNIAANITMSLDWEMPVDANAVYEVQYSPIYGTFGTFGGAKSLKVEVKKNGIPISINLLPKPNDSPCANPK